MATVNLLTAFTYKWAENGTVNAIDDAQWKAGWAYIGATPPSVEQFNKWGQIFDEKSNYLYGQLSAVFTAASQVPASGTATTLRDALRATGLFQTAAPGTNDTKAATTAFVAAAIAASGGKLLGVRLITATGTYTPTAGTQSVYVRLVGGGGSGGNTAATAGAQASAGSGGGAGGAAESYLTTGFSGVTVTIGAGGGAGLSAAGGASSFGALMTCNGGAAGTLGSAISNAGANVPVGQGVGGTATGGNLMNANGGSGTYALVGNSPLGGSGGASAWGPGPSYASATLPGVTATSPGAGGGGACNGPSQGANGLGGGGAAGRCIIFEFG